MDGLIKTGPSVSHRVRLTKRISAHQLMAAVMKHAKASGAYTVKFSQCRKTFQGLILLKPFAEGLKDGKSASRRERQLASSHSERKPNPEMRAQKQDATPSSGAGDTTPAAQRRPKPQSSAGSPKRDAATTSLAGDDAVMEEADGQPTPQLPTTTGVKMLKPLTAQPKPKLQHPPPPPPPKQSPQPPTSKPLPEPTQPTQPPPPSPFRYGRSPDDLIRALQRPTPPSLNWRRPSQWSHRSDGEVRQTTVTPVYHFKGDMHTHTDLPQPHMGYTSADFPPLSPNPKITTAQKWRVARAKERVRAQEWGKVSAKWETDHKI